MGEQLPVSPLVRCVQEQRGQCLACRTTKRKEEARRETARPPTRMEASTAGTVPVLLGPSPQTQLLPGGPASSAPSTLARARTAAQGTLWLHLSLTARGSRCGRTLRFRDASQAQAFPAAEDSTRVFKCSDVRWLLSGMELVEGAPSAVFKGLSWSPCRGCFCLFSHPAALRHVLTVVGCS